MADIAPVILLASGSPRRRELLGALGLPFAVTTTDIDEDAILRGDGTPEEKALMLARVKAEAVTEVAEPFVVTADTVVAAQGAVLGKPGSPEEAQEMLASLRAADHEVITAVAVRCRSDGRVSAGAATTQVRMRPYTESEVLAYIATGDPLDKAGAYAIQHQGFRPVERISGCYWNVVGLPLCLLSAVLAEAGAPVVPARATEPGRCTLCGPEGVAAVPFTSDPARKM